MTVPRFECVDRNIVSVIQREVYINSIEAVYPVNGVALNVGGPPGEYAFHSLCVDVVRNIENVGTECEGWGKDILAYGERLPIKDNSIAKIYSSHSLEHVMDAEGSLYEWHRALRQGGLLVIIVPAYEFHKHDPQVTALGDRAPSEHTTKEFKEIVDRVIEKTGMKLLLFNTRRNNFDIDIILQKAGDLPTQMEAVDSRVRYTNTDRRGDLVGILKDVLACPLCKSGDLEFEDFTNYYKSKNKVTCKSCGTIYMKCDFRLDESKIWELWGVDYGYTK